MEMRCSECLEEFKQGEKRFAILKVIQDEDNFTGRLKSRHEERVVCAGCAGWHRDAIEIPEGAGR